MFNEDLSEWDQWCQYNIILKKSTIVCITLVAWYFHVWRSKGKTCCRSVVFSGFSGFLLTSNPSKGNSYKLLIHYYNAWNLLFQGLYGSFFNKANIAWCRYRKNSKLGQYPIVEVGCFNTYSRTCLIRHTKGSGKCVWSYRILEYSGFILVNRITLGP